MWEENILQLVGCLPGMCKALGSNPNNTETGWRGVHACDPRPSEIQAGRFDVQSHSQTWQVQSQSGIYEILSSKPKSKQTPLLPTANPLVNWLTSSQVLTCHWDGWSMTSYTQNSIYIWENCTCGAEGAVNEGLWVGNEEEWTSTLRYLHTQPRPSCTKLTSSHLSPTTHGARRSWRNGELEQALSRRFRLPGCLLTVIPKYKAILRLQEDKNLLLIHYHLIYLLRLWSDIWVGLIFIE